MSPKSHKRQVESAPKSGDATDSIELIYKRELLRLVGQSYSSIFTWMRRGEFPLARQIGPASRNSKSAWFRHEVMAWLAARPQRRLSPPPQRDGGKVA
jgi:predicted DNA-binding transcriptional regulator AlpA